MFTNMRVWRKRKKHLAKEKETTRTCTCGHPCYNRTNRVGSGWAAWQERKVAVQAQTDIGSRAVARAAVLLSMSRDREEETTLRSQLAAEGIAAVAADFGGEFVGSILRIVERAVVAAKREHVISESHLEEGSVAGAAREALNQITPKALGMNVGGKIGVARHGEHVAVALFFGIGLGHLDEVCIGLGHRAI